ncbi:MAG: response regulator [Myxococcales bacterium]|nr:response regulator [Myxococcales bacterium]
MTVPARILVVDDDPGSRMSLAGLLEDEGYAVEEAATVGAAREKLARQAFDLAILDRDLNGEDGLALLPALREQHPEAKAVLLSGGSEPVQAAIDARLIKGSPPDEMLETIAALLRS